MTQLRIDVGLQRNRYIFQLHPNSRHFLDSNYPDSPRTDSLVLSYWNQHSIEQLSNGNWLNIFSLVTGLSPSQLEQFDDILVYDPHPNKLVYQLKSQHVTTH